MQAIIERCCGLDVYQETVVACLLIGAAGARARKEVRTFRTVRRELEALRDWLKAAGVTHVGMESTGVETANIKLASVMSDVFGVAGRDMLRALIAGRSAPEEVAGLAGGQLRRKRAELIEALTGGVEEHHRFLLAMQLGRIEAIEADIAALDARIAERLLPYSAEMALLMTIPGVNWLVGAVIIAEIG